MIYRYKSQKIPKTSCIRNVKDVQNVKVFITHYKISVFEQSMNHANVRENRMDNRIWTIQRHWKHWVHKAQDEDKIKNPTHITQKTQKLPTKTGGECR